jgi:hypothetical protein
VAGWLRISIEKLQVLPPIVAVKFAMPALVGVPDSANTKLPFPLFRIPESRVAVRPVTPVEFIL